MRTRFAAPILSLIFLINAEPAFAAGCQGTKITSTAIDPVPLMDAGYNRVGEIAGKTKKKSLSLGVLDCMGDLYKVEWNGQQGWLRRAYVITSVEALAPICPDAIGAKTQDYDRSTQGAGSGAACRQVKGN